MSNTYNPNSSVDKKELKATLLSDKELTSGSVEFEENFSAWTRFTQNVESKAISALVYFPPTSTLANKFLTNKAASSGTVS